ncbi:MAG: universal stress protein [Dehalococcoidales bacterium]|nr:universal stress protein [Dehalococcoidales bacterium]
MFEKILVCLDGSPFAEKIIGVIADETRRLGSELILFRAVSLPETIIPISVPGAPVGPAITKGEINRTVREEDEAAAYLDKIAQPLIEKGILKIESVVLPGNAGEAIINYAEANGCTLIVMASHGHGGFRRLTLGSTAEHVLHHAKTPLLIVR